MKKNLTREDFKSSIILVIETNGEHYICMPEDDNIEFSHQACKTIDNALMAVNNPSLVLRFFLWLEKQLLTLNTFLRI